MKLLRQLRTQPARTGHHHGRNPTSPADAVRPRPEGIAVTPAIGPLPAILVPAAQPAASDGGSL